MTTLPPDRLALRPAEAARAIGVCRATLYKLLDAGEIPSKRHAGKRLILVRDLQAWLDGLAGG